MARKKNWTWTVSISLLVGVVGASIFWLYSPYGHDRRARQEAGDLKAQPLPGVGQGAPVNLKKMASQAMGARYQMVADGKQVFMVDLTNGRVWRYYHHTKEAGFSMEDEGFLPIGLFYAGKKHYAASEIDPPPGAPGIASQTSPAGKQPQ